MLYYLERGLLNSKIDAWFCGTEVPDHTPSDVIPKPFANPAGDGKEAVKAALETAKSFLEKKGRKPYVWVPGEAAGDDGAGVGGRMEVEGDADVTRATEMSVGTPSSPA